jgi:hypothetical protein
MAMSSFLVGGGDGFPIIPRPAQLFNVTDRDVLLAYLLQLGAQSGGASQPLDNFLPFDMRLTRRERFCSRDYIMEVQKGWHVNVTKSALSQLPSANTSNTCVEMEVEGFARFFAAWHLAHICVDCAGAAKRLCGRDAQ